MGLVVGAGVCYCVYRATSRKRKNEGTEEAGLKRENAQKEHEERQGSTSSGEAPMATPEQAPVLANNIFSSTKKKDSSHPQPGNNSKFRWPFCDWKHAFSSSY